MTSKQSIEKRLRRTYTKQEEEGIQTGVGTGDGVVDGAEGPQSIIKALGRAVDVEFAQVSHGWCCFVG